MRRPNLILLTVECFRNDHFGVDTPNLVQLGEESAVFRKAYAAGGWTLPSMTALMSSAYASMFGGCGVGLESPERQTLAESLLNNGYWTAAFIANPVCGGLKGFHRGFGRFREEKRQSSFSSQQREEMRRDWEKAAELGVHPRTLDAFCDARHMTDKGLEWVGTMPSNRPWFLWLHYMDPHWPCYTTPSEDPQDICDAWHDRQVFTKEVCPKRGRYDPGEKMTSRWIARYREALNSADREIGRLLDGLRSRPDWDQTIVAVMGDHGEEFMEHGTWHHSWNRLHREGIHVPLIVRTPGTPACEVHQFVSGLDVAPTLLDYAQVTSGSSVRPMMGTSLRPLMEGGSMPERPVFVEMLAHPASFTYRLAILEGEWKYLYDLDTPHDSMLFRHDADPAETENVRHRYPTVFRRFETMRLAHVTLGLTSIMDRIRLKDDSLEMDEAVREQMVALGYLSAEG